MTFATIDLKEKTVDKKERELVLQAFQKAYQEYHILLDNFRDGQRVGYNLQSQITKITNTKLCLFICSSFTLIC